MTPDEITRHQQGSLPALLGIEWLRAEHALVSARLAILPHHLAPNGFLHAATVVVLADTACGYGCMGALPDDASGFTTIELKTNLIGTVREGAIVCDATLVHGGRSTQVWDATVRDERSDKVIALFRCTQMVLRLTADQHS